MVVGRLLLGGPEAVWENDVQLQRFSMRQDTLGGLLWLDYVWMIGQRHVPTPGHPLTSLRFGNYLLSVDGQLLSQVDGVTTDSREWRAGDVINRQWRLPIPSAISSTAMDVATAIYSLPEIQRVPLDGQSGDLWVLSEVDIAPSK